MSDAAPRPLRIAVCGGGRAGAVECALAERVGARIAEAGAVLVCGGLGGCMEAAARGAHERGGITVGVLPGTDTTAANPYIALPLPTGLGEARNTLVVRFAEAVVAVGGEWGTLSEVAFAMKVGIPVVLLAPTLGATLPCEVADSPESAVDRALELAHERSRT